MIRGSKVRFKTSAISGVYIVKRVRKGMVELVSNSGRVLGWFEIECLEEVEADSSDI